jgi:hypothetical protein
MPTSFCSSLTKYRLAIGALQAALSVMQDGLAISSTSRPRTERR